MRRNTGIIIVVALILTMLAYRVIIVEQQQVRKEFEKEAIQMGYGKYILVNDGVSEPYIKFVWKETNEK
jgi:hypothetical protein